MSLNEKQRLFVAEYLVDLNATQAAIRAGYSRKTAGRTGHENLKKPEIAAAIARAFDSRIERTEVSADRVLLEYARIGLSDMRQFASWGPDGVVWKTSDELDDGAAACVAEVSETVSEGGRTRRFKLHSKLAALDKLAQHVKLFGEERSPGSTVNINVNVKPEEERARDVLALHEQIAAYRKGYEDAGHDALAPHGLAPHAAGSHGENP